MQDRRPESSGGREIRLPAIAPRQDDGPSLGSHVVLGDAPTESRRNRLPPRSRSGCWYEQHVLYVDIDWSVIGHVELEVGWSQLMLLGTRLLMLFKEVKCDEQRPSCGVSCAIVVFREGHDTDGYENSAMRTTKSSMVCSCLSYPLSNTVLNYRCPAITILVFPSEMIPPESWR